MTALVRGWRAAAAILGFFLFAGAAAAQFPAAYIGEPDVRDASVSPSGAEVVLLKTGYREGIRQVRYFDTLSVVDAATGDERVLLDITSGNGLDDGAWFFSQVIWLDDGLIVAEGLHRQRRNRRNVDFYRRLVAIDPANGTWRELTSTDRLDLDEGLPPPSRILRYSASQNRLALAVPDGERLDFAVVDLASGRTLPRVRGTRDTAGWVARQDLTPALRLDETAGGTVIEYHRPVGEGWQLVRRHNVLDAPFRVVTTIGGDPLNVVALARREGADTVGLHELDIATGELGGTLLEVEGFDLSGAASNIWGSGILHASHWEDGQVLHFFDPALQKRGDALARALGGDNFRVIDASEDGDTWLLLVSAPQRPPQFFLYDASEKRLRRISKGRFELDESALSQTERFDYAAADGTPLFGYLTPAKLPENSLGGRKGLMVMPHGGPVARDHLDFDGLAQFFAARGFDVFQPQFRGGGGFGKAFAEAGHGEWGGIMQTDILDGIAALEREGRTDPALPRVAVGASYGGFAVLWGTTRTDLYSCTVSINGLSDLAAFLRSFDQENPVEGWLHEVWSRRIGGLETDADAEALAYASPAAWADSASAPILLMVGAEDEIVPPDQSGVMHRALEAAGRPAELISFDGMGHSPASPQEWNALLANADRFISRCLIDREMGRSGG